MSAFVYFQCKSLTEGIHQLPAPRFAFDSFQLADRMQRQLVGFLRSRRAGWRRSRFFHVASIAHVFIIGEIKLEINFL